MATASGIKALSWETRLQFAVEFLMIHENNITNYGR